LWSDFLSGSISYTLEQVGISLNSPYHPAYTTYSVATSSSPTSPGQVVPQQLAPDQVPSNVPQAILDQTGAHLFNRFGASLAYDTRNSTQLPNHGQLTEIDPQISLGDVDYYQLQLRTSWYFPGLLKGHVIEAVGRVGIAQGVDNAAVPFYDAYYLGGLYSLRGFKFRNVGPRDPAYDPGNPAGIPNEPVGGDSMWFGSVEYSIPIVEKDSGLGVRVAAFFDAGSVGTGTTTFSGNFDDDVGLGLRMNIPHLGPLRLDYGIPITHDQYNGRTGQFQFGAGYTRQF
jgi:outer membrane protein insertion porin family